MTETNSSFAAEANRQEGATWFKPPERVERDGFGAWLHYGKIEHDNVVRAFSDAEL
jgi:hypothetical protein